MGGVATLDLLWNWYVLWRELDLDLTYPSDAAAAALALALL